MAQSMADELSVSEDGRTYQIRQPLSEAVARIQTCLGNDWKVELTRTTKDSDLNPAYDGDPDTLLRTSIVATRADGTKVSLVALTESSCFTGEKDTSFVLELNEIRHGIKTSGGNRIGCRNDLPAAEQKFTTLANKL